LTDQPGLDGTAARLASWPDTQNGVPDSSANATGHDASDSTAAK